MARTHSLVAVVCLALAACTPAPSIDATCPAAPFQDPGPYAAGVTTLDVDGVAVEVWYPIERGSIGGSARDEYDMRDWLPDDMRALIAAEAPTRFTTDAYRDVPASDAGPFPVVLFSHGLGGFRAQSSFLTTHLAAWGFVVVAPEHAERNLSAVLRNELRDEAVPQLEAALEAIRAEGSRAGGLLEGAVDASRVGLMGHSAGGGALAALIDQRGLEAQAWVGLATIAAPQREMPGFLLGGTADQIAVPETVERTFDDLAHSSKRYLSVEGAGHLAFSDICLIGRERGGVLQIAQDSGVPISSLVIRLASDGCRPEDLPAEQAWPTIRHYVTAHFRAALSDERTSPSGLEPASTSCFESRVAIYR